LKTQARRKDLKITALNERIASLEAELIHPQGQDSHQLQNEKLKNRLSQLEEENALLLFRVKQNSSISVKGVSLDSSKK
jgi:hypothetical protein